MDVIRQLGPLALGSRLKRLSDRLMQDGIKIYKHVGLDFEPKWFPVYYYLAEIGPSSVMEIARGVGITHPSVNQIAKEMISKGYVAAYKDPKDKRKRVLALSSLGKSQKSSLQRIWRVIDQVITDLIAESDQDLLDKIHALEENLQKTSFEQRFLSQIENPTNKITIVPYRNEFAEAFKQINQTWIEEFFEMEEADRRALEQPESYILAKGGEILFALDEQDQVVGTCALIRHSAEMCELAKMGVDKSSQSRGAGKLLGEAILDLAIAKGFQTVCLETNSSLEPAIRLYKKLGFKQLPPPVESEYQRADVYMELDLSAKSAR